MPHKRRRFVRILLNPLVVVSLVVALMTAGWLVYTGGQSMIAQARPGANLLPPLSPSAEATPGSSGTPTVTSAPSPNTLSVPDTSSATDTPSTVDAVAGWSVGHSADAAATLNLVDGQVDDQALKLDVGRYASGDVTLTSPRVEVDPGETYLFKAFVSTDTHFTLLARQHHTDGSTTLRQLPSVLERPGNAPFSVSDAFDSGDTVTAVEYVFRLASEGSVRVEGAYLEAAEDVALPPSTPAAPNLIPNPELVSPTPGVPASWSPYASGPSTVESGRGDDEDGPFLWTRITNYKSGEAKWQYQPVPVAPDRRFEFGATYRSEREVDVLAEFELEDGGRVFRNLATVQPAGEWTTIGESFQVPDKAKTVMVTLVSHGDGTTAVRDYSLTDITKPGPLRWDKPMVSITFDDGWESVYDRALPLLDKHGFRSTQYVNPTSLETPNFMTAAEVRGLHEAGHEIAAHSYSHVDLTSINAERLEEEMRRNEEALNDAGLGTDNLAPPFGRSDPQVDWYASQYFTTVRGTDVGINTRQSIDPSDLKVFYVTDETTPELLREALAETDRVNGWLILVYHQISTPESTGTQDDDTIVADQSTITSDALAAQLQIVDDSGIEVQPVTQAFDQLQDQ
ncbi:polysaccharide deacetylase family protein [Arthrobacter sp. SX1312]|uniref:polysaccharide deacetylase family protein n=1 Tax=Arthrobacter sp. SX1312 TaxID=2058896 RepID=UPI000CE4E267|nr:polysaccharide deacetylase family protein [Arthrobacter sp. SX1312]